MWWRKWIVWRYWLKLFNQKVLCHLLRKRIAGTYWPTQKVDKVEKSISRSVPNYPPSSQTSVSMLIQAGLILLLWRGLQLGFFVISGWVSSMPSSSSIISDDDSDIELFFKCWPAKQTRNGVRSSAAGALLQFQKSLRKVELKSPPRACFPDNPRRLCRFLFNRSTSSRDGRREKLTDWPGQLAPKRIKGRRHAIPAQTLAGICLSTTRTRNQTRSSTLDESDPFFLLYYYSASPVEYIFLQP